jgi:nucleotidyltransferase/DNA polymerase involved in DNA repair
MVGEFVGVPRPALEAVFGRTLGRRIWEHNRKVTSRKGEVSPGAAEALAAASAAVIAGPEIAHGIIKHLSQRAADTLRQNGRKARCITLELTYADGTSKMERLHLGAPTDEPRELMAASEELIVKMPLNTAVQSMSVHVSSVAARSLGKERECIEPTLVSAAHALACAR